MLRKKASYGNKVDSDLTHCFINQWFILQKVVVSTYWLQFFCCNHIFVKKIPCSVLWRWYPAPRQNKFAQSYRTKGQPYHFMLPLFLSLCWPSDEITQVSKSREMQSFTDLYIFPDELYCYSQFSYSKPTSTFLLKFWKVKFSPVRSAERQGTCFCYP